jgi:hypothetical protein
MFIVPRRRTLLEEPVAQDDAVFDDLVLEAGQVDFGDDPEDAGQVAGRSPRARA